MSELFSNFDGILLILKRMAKGMPLAGLETAEAVLYEVPTMILASAKDMPPALIEWKMPGSINGYVYLQKPEVRMLLSNDKDLESVDFNQKTLTYASNDKLPYSLFPPDFMSWYLDLPEAPIIFVKDEKGYAVFMTALNGSDAYQEIASKLILPLIKSGAAGA